MFFQFQNIKKMSQAAPIPPYMDERVWSVDKVPGIYMIKDDDLTFPLVFIFVGSLFIGVLLFIFISGEQQEFSIGILIALIAFFSLFPIFGFLQKSTDFIFNDKSRIFVVRTKRAVSGKLVANRTFHYRDIRSFECELDCSTKVNGVPSGKIFINILVNLDSVQRIQISDHYVSYPEAQLRINQMNEHLKIILKNQI